MLSLNYEKIKGLIYTEKSNNQLTKNKYTFKVTRDCNKSDIKFLLKKIFGIEVKKSNVINVSGKIKRFKGILGKKQSYKKVIVTIEKNNSINFDILK